MNADARCVAAALLCCSLSHSFVGPLALPATLTSARGATLARAGRRDGFGSAAPTTLSWAVGDGAVGDGAQAAAASADGAFPESKEEVGALFEEWERNRKRAAANKGRREPPRDKKRKLSIEAQRTMKLRTRRAAAKQYVPRMDKTADKALSTLAQGQWVDGVVCTLRDHGAFVDVGAEVDGLLHVRDLSDSGFVDHPGDVLALNTTVSVCIKFVDPDRQKLALALYAVDASSGAALRPHVDPVSFDERRPVDDLREEELVFGQVTKVTNFGAYVDCGIEGGLLAFVHISDVPDRVPREPATATYSVGDRVRLYVKEVEWPSEGGELDADDKAEGVDAVIGRIREKPKQVRVRLSGMRPVGKAWVAW